MSGHSKWSKVKHQKATTDVVKAREFTKASRAIILAVGEGGGISDPDHNVKLRLAIEKARAVNMPKENIDRAIEKARGSGAAALERMQYEAYAPGGVAILIMAATDNRNRTVSEIKSILICAGGSLVANGAASYAYDAQITVPVDAAIAAQIDELIESLEALDDVQDVRTNHEIT